MRVTKLDSSQNFQGIRAYHNAKKKAFYGIAAGCALMAATCGFSYAKNANPDGYRSSTNAHKQISAKELLLLVGSLSSFVGGLFSLKKADDEKELEDLYKFKEEIDNTKSKYDIMPIETLEYLEEDESESTTQKKK